MNRLVINEDQSIYVDGYKYILKYETTEIILKLSKKQIVIQGNKLIIINFCNTEMLIKGEITRISFVKD